jgi:hypothetical protein
MGPGNMVEINSLITLDRKVPGHTLT